MALFAYRALTAAGETVSGFTVAGDVASALSGLRGRGVYVTEMDQRTDDEMLPGRVRDVPAFCRHLAMLLEAGMHLIPAIQAVKQSLSRRDELLVADYLVEALSQGESLSAALGRFPSSFPPDVTAVLASGEETASLPEALRSVADTVETGRRRRADMLAAVAYPAFVLLLSAAVVLLLVTFVFPRLSPLLPKGDALPLPTRILFFAGGVMHQALPWLLVALVIAGVFLWPMRRRIPAFLSDFSLRVPFLSRVVATAEMARFSQTMSGLLGGGIGIVKAISLASQAVSSSSLRQRLETAKEQVSEGRSLASAFSDVEHMPPVVLAALSVGEESRSLPRTLKLVSDEMYRRLDRGFRMLVSFLTPVLIIMAGVIVAWIVAAVILPVTAQAVD